MRKMFALLPCCAAMTAMISSPVIAADGFAALAFSQSRAFAAVALNKPSRIHAEQAALASCQAQAPDCTSPVWVENGCVSIAIGKGIGFGTGWGATRASAEQEAISVCAEKTSGCLVKRTACTTGR